MRLLIFLAMFIVPNFGYAGGSDSISQFKLTNGLEVIVAKRPGPILLHCLIYKVGAYNDLVGKSGLAHFVEHMMFGGTKKFSKHSFDNEITKIGGIFNAYTDPDKTAYYEVVPLSALAKVMEMEADRMKSAMIDDKNVNNEIKIITEEKRMKELDPQWTFLESMIATLYKGHPYALGVIGSEKDIASVRASDVLKHYNTYYKPDNAVLLVVGNVSDTHVYSLAKKYYGPIKPGNKISPSDRLQLPDGIGNIKVIAKDKNTSVSQVWRFYLTDKLDRNNLKHSVMRNLISIMLTGGRASRLDMEVKSTVNIHTSSTERIYYPGTFEIYADVKEGETPGKVEQDLDLSLANVVKNGFIEDELAFARGVLRMSYLMTKQSLRAIAHRSDYAAMLAVGMSFQDVYNIDNLLNTINLTEVNELAKNLFSGEHRHVTGYLLSD
jgi:zinc protease